MNRHWISRPWLGHKQVRVQPHHGFVLVGQSWMMPKMLGPEFRLPIVGHQMDDHHHKKTTKSKSCREGG